MPESSVIGNAWVEVGANLGPLRAAIAEAKQLTQNLESQVKPKLAFAIDSVDLPKQVQNVKNWLANVKVSLPLTVTIDTAQAMAQMRALIQSMQGQAHAITIGVNTVGTPTATAGVGASSIGAASQQIMPQVQNIVALLERTNVLLESGFISLGGSAGGGGGGGTGPAGVGGGTGTGAGRGRNPFGVYGLGRAVGSIAAAYLIQETLQVASGVAGAYETMSHPERELRQYTQFGASFNAAGNPFMQGQASIAAQIKGSQQATAALEGIPLLGAAFHLGDILTGHSTHLEDQAYQTSESMRAYSQLQHIMLDQPIQEAKLAGNPVTALAREQANKRLPLQVEAEKLKDLQAQAAVAVKLDQTARELAGKYLPGLIPGGTKPRDIHQIDPVLAGQIDVSGLSSKALEDQKKLDAEELRQAGKRRELQVEATERHGGELRAQLQFGDLSPEAKAQRKLKEDHAIDAQVVNMNPREAQGARGEDAARRQLRDEGEARSQQATLLHAETEGHAARLRASQQFWAAQKYEMQRAEQAELLEAAAHGQAFVDIVTKKYEELNDAAKVEHERSVRIAGTSAVVGTAAAELRGAGFDFKSQMLQRADEQQKALGATENIIQWALLKRQFATENQAAIDIHARQSQATSIGLGARAASANAQVMDQPKQAQALQFAAKARQELLLADPEHFEETQKAVLAELAAQQQQLTGVRGGVFGTAVRADWVDPDFLGQRQRDQAMAKKTLAGATRDVRGQQPRALPADESLVSKLLSAVGIGGGGKAGDMPTGWYGDVVASLKTIADKVDKLVAVAG